MSFFWTQKLGFTPDPFRRLPENQMERTRKQMRIVPRTILILKWVSLSVSPHKNSAQTRLPTGAILQDPSPRVSYLVIAPTISLLWMSSGGHMIWNFSQTKVYIKVTKQTFPEVPSRSLFVDWVEGIVCGSFRMNFRINGVSLISINSCWVSLWESRSITKL